MYPMYTLSCTICVIPIEVDIAVVAIPCQKHTELGVDVHSMLSCMKYQFKTLLKTLFYKLSKRTGNIT